MGEQCSLCRFFLMDDGDKVGLCRRFPAQWTTDDRGFEFPAMKPIGWCGEYSPKQRH